ncbi:MAG: hypothetical protein AB4911_25505, partial [Oscillochloridaceae bacterium umkhey_bin13]
PAFEAAREDLAAQRYEQAVGKLRPLLLDAQRRNDPREANEITRLEEVLAQAYLDWGRATVASSEGDLRELNQAYNQFNDGVSVTSPASAFWEALTNERAMALAMIDAAQSLNKLEQDLATGTADRQLRDPVELLISQFVDMHTQQPDYPGLAVRYAQVLVTGGTIYERSPGETKPDQLQALSRAIELCGNTVARAQLPEQARACLDRATTKLNRLNATPTPTSDPVRLRFRVENYNDEPHCITVQVRRISTAGWTFSVDGLTHLRGNFDNAGNARLCGLNNDQQVTITVFDRNGRPVAGGRGVPSKGRAIMVAEWR